MELSIVIPVYNEGEPLRILCDKLITVLARLVNEFELLLVDDRSKDNSWEVMKDLAIADSRIKVVRLARNFGQHSALTAGLSLAQGKYVVMMDCDQQDNPADVEMLYRKIVDSNAKIVYARRTKRKDGWFKTQSSKFLNYILQSLSGIKFDSSIGTFRIMEDFVVKSYLSMPEHNRYIGGMFFWLDFQADFVDVVHQSRYQGSSNYNLKKLIKLARLGILSSSTKLLSLGIYMGLISSILSVIFGLYFVIMKIFFNVPLGFTSVIVSVFFVGSIIMLILGITGEYLREIFEEVKGRPNFIIEEAKNITI